MAGVHIVKGNGFEILFVLGAGDDIETVENIDAVVTLSNGTRWSATILSINEIQTIMDRWRESGECLSGAYFSCPDLLIVRDGGIPSMVRSLEDVLVNGGPEGVLVRLDRDASYLDDESE